MLIAVFVLLLLFAFSQAFEHLIAMELVTTDRATASNTAVTYTEKAFRPVRFACLLLRLLLSLCCILLVDHTLLNHRSLAIRSQVRLALEPDLVRGCIVDRQLPSCPSWLQEWTKNSASTGLMAR